jgi:hypothetical protein
LYHALPQQKRPAPGERQSTQPPDRCTGLNLREVYAETVSMFVTRSDHLDRFIGVRAAAHAKLVHGRPQSVVPERSARRRWGWRRA